MRISLNKKDAAKMLQDYGVLKLGYEVRGVELSGDIVSFVCGKSTVSQDTSKHRKTFTAKEWKSKKKTARNQEGSE